jgi:hypothetical protein
VKHHIKAVDRLLGNRHLQRECAAIYRDRGDSTRARSKPRSRRRLVRL